MCSCCGNSPPRTNSPSSTLRATISRIRPHWWSRPPRCWRCSMRRTISAVLAVPRGVSRRRPPRSCSRRWPPSRKRPASRRRSMPGRPSWYRASARSQSASSSTRSCSSRTRTRPSTRPWCMPPRKRRWRRWTCCSAPVPSTRPTSSTGSASCSSTSPRARAFRRCRLRASMIPNCRWPRCRPSPSTIPAPPRSTTRCP